MRPSLAQHQKSKEMTMENWTCEESSLLAVILRLLGTVAVELLDGLTAVGCWLLSIVVMPVGVELLLLSCLMV